mgnify:CR=1
MSWHIIGAFVGVNVIRGVLWNHCVHMAFKIGSHRMIRIFVDGQASGCVLDEYLEHSGLDLSDFGYSIEYFLGNQLKPTTVCF